LNLKGWPGIEPIIPELPTDIEVVRRQKKDTSWTFFLNHGTRSSRLIASGHELITGTDLTGKLNLEPGAVAVVRSSV
jgi:beta-galactosidase